MPELSINFLLAHSCPSGMIGDDGYDQYVIELHCITVNVFARKVKDGVMDQDTGQWIEVPQYEVRNFQWGDS